MPKSVKALITPEVLKWVREKRIRLEIDFVAKKLKIDRERLVAWENGTDKPTFTQLKKIAKLYKTHISIFYLPKPPTTFHRPVDYRVFPKSKAPDAEQTYKLKANIVEAHERRARLIGYYELLEEPPPKVSVIVNLNEPHRNAAEKITQFLEFNREKLPKTADPYKALKFWKQTVEAKGILVCGTSANTHLSLELQTARGFCIAQKPFPVIVVNPKDSPYGRIFTIIHELVHIAMGKSVIQNTGYSDIRKPALNDTEVFCNMVAGEVLVPEDELLERIDLNTLKEDIPEISKHFQVSSEVIMRRLLILKKITQQKYYTYRKMLHDKYERTQNDIVGGIPYHTRLLSTFGEHYTRYAFSAYYENKITLAELSAAFYNCSTKHLFEIESKIYT